MHHTVAVYEGGTGEEAAAVDAFGKANNFARCVDPKGLGNRPAKRSEVVGGWIDRAVGSGAECVNPIPEKSFIGIQADHLAGGVDGKSPATPTETKRSEVVCGRIDRAVRGRPETTSPEAGIADHLARGVDPIGR